MKKTAVITAILCSILLPNLRASELLKVSRADIRDRIQLYFSFDTPPGYSTVQNDRRIDLIFADSSKASRVTMFDSDAHIVKILPHSDGGNLVVSLFFRYPPQKYAINQSADNTLVLEIVLGNEYSKTFQALTEKLKGLTLVDRSGEDFSSPSVRSPYVKDWMSFYSRYEAPIAIKLPVKFSSPPFPIGQFLPEIGEKYRQLLTDTTLELAKEKHWGRVSSQILAKVQQPQGEETGSFLALSYAEALARNGDFKQLYLLRQQHHEELLGIYADYLLLCLRPPVDDPHLAYYEFCRLDKALAGHSPLTPYVLLSRIEAALATANYPEMNILLQKNDVALPSDVAGMIRIRQADYWYAIKQYAKAFDAYRPEAAEALLDNLPFSTGGYCDTLYDQKNFVQAGRCYDKLSTLVSGKDQLSMVLYRKYMSRLKYMDGSSLIDAFADIESTYVRTEAAYRAALKRIDLLLLKDKSASGQAIEEYTRIGGESSLRSIREEALFKTALLHAMMGDNSLAIQELQSLLREFQIGDVRISAQALLIDILPAEIKRLVDNKEYLPALVLAKQNRDLFRNNWLDSRFLVDIAEAYQKIGMFDEAKKLYLYLIEISAVDQQENFYLPMIQATFAHGDYSLAEDYATQYVYNFPSGRYAREVLYIRLRSLMADDRLEDARRLLPEPLPQKREFLSLAAQLYFRLDDHGQCLTALENLSALHAAFSDRQQFMYAESLYRTGNWQAAQKAFEKIANNNSFSDLAFYRQAQLARKDGNDKIALSFLQKIVEKGREPLWKELAEREMKFMEATENM